jgi:hypothetical protein
MYEFIVFGRATCPALPQIMCIYSIYMYMYIYIKQRQMKHTDIKVQCYVIFSFVSVFLASLFKVKGCQPHP